MKLKRVVPSLLFAIGLLTTTVAADKPVSDDFLTDTIRARLAADSVVKGGAIEVDVHEGAVVLKGKVEEDKISSACVPKKLSKASRASKALRTKSSSLTLKDHP
jgi:hypothetical protein